MNGKDVQRVIEEVSRNIQAYKPLNGIGKQSGESFMFSEPDGQPHRAEEERSIGRPDEFGPESRIQHDTRADLVAEAHPDSRWVALACQIGLTREDVGNNGVAKTRRITEGVTDGSYDTVGSAPFLRLRRSEKGVANIHVGPPTPE